MGNPRACYEPVPGPMPISRAQPDCAVVELGEYSNNVRIPQNPQTAAILTDNRCRPKRTAASIKNPVYKGCHAECSIKVSGVVRAGVLDSLLLLGDRATVLASSDQPDLAVRAA